MKLMDSENEWIPPEDFHTLEHYMDVGRYTCALMDKILSPTELKACSVAGKRKKEWKATLVSCKVEIYRR